MDRLVDLLPQFWENASITLMLVGVAMLFGGLGGLVLGVLLTVTRSGGVLANKAVFTILNIVVNFFRPIPFMIFIAVVQPLARVTIGTGIGNEAFMLAMSLAAMFGISRLVEQNLVSVDPGVIEAARSMGASPVRIIRTVILPEALGPLILGYTFAVVAVLDMSVQAGILGGDGIGNFAIVYGYRQYNPWVTWAAVIIMVIFVQLVQTFGNWLARRVMRR